MSKPGKYIMCDHGHNVNACMICEIARSREQSIFTKPEPLAPEHYQKLKEGISKTHDTA